MIDFFVFAKNNRIYLNSNEELGYIHEITNEHIICNLVDNDNVDNLLLNKSKIPAGYNDLLFVGEIIKFNNKENSCFFLDTKNKWVKYTLKA